MLAEIMLVLQLLGSGLYLVVDDLAAIGHFGAFLHDHRVVDRLKGILAPGKGAVVLAQAAGYRDGVLAQPVKFRDDQQPGVLLIGVLDLFLGQAAETGNVAVEIVRVGGA